MSEALDIRTVTREEFLALPRPGRGRGAVLSQENRAVGALRVGKAVSFPCRWKHNPGCTGHSTIRKYIDRHPPLYVSARCHQGRFYVLRLEDKKP